MKQQLTTKRNKTIIERQKPTTRSHRTKTT